MEIKLIRKRRNSYALVFAIAICLTVWFAVEFVVEATFAFGVISIISLIFLEKQSRLLYDLILIWDNRILAVPSAIVSTPGDRGKKDMEQIVVSTFGILIGTKIYRWGCDGVHGVRLTAIEIEQEWMYLTFGDAVQTMRVEILHGLEQRQMILDLTQKLWSETGITASINGW